ncbi:MAG: metallophosphoesterase [Halobacteriales archaeon]
MPTAAEPFGSVRDRAVYLPDAGTLVAADLHLGRAEVSGVDAPVDQGPAIVDRLLALVERFDPTTVVLAGDVLDAFDRVPRAARHALGALRAGLDAADTDLVTLAGNHDTQLAALAGDSPARVHQLADGTVVCHGHERPATAGARYVVGHDHPVIDIEGRRRPCYLFGPEAYEGADVLGLPAFNRSLRGTAVNGWRDGDPLSPLLAEVSRYRPVVRDAEADETLVFPTLDAMRPFLG